MVINNFIVATKNITEKLNQKIQAFLQHKQQNAKTVMRFLFLCPLTTVINFFTLNLNQHKASIVNRSKAVPIMLLILPIILSRNSHILFFKLFSPFYLKSMQIHFNYYNILLIKYTLSNIYYLDVQEKAHCRYEVVMDTSRLAPIMPA